VLRGGGGEGGGGGHLFTCTVCSRSTWCGLVLTMNPVTPLMTSQHVRGQCAGDGAGNQVSAAAAPACKGPNRECSECCWESRQVQTPFYPPPSLSLSLPPAHAHPHVLVHTHTRSLSSFTHTRTHTLSRSTPYTRTRSYTHTRALSPLSHTHTYTHTQRRLTPSLSLRSKGLPGQPACCSVIKGANHELCLPLRSKGLPGQPAYCASKYAVEGYSYGARFPTEIYTR
jgi:hypothetical protein